MLKLRHLLENYSLAKKALENWEHDYNTVDELLSQFRISSNAIYPFSINSKIQFLRLAPISEKFENNVYGELEFIEYLNSNGYPALKPVKSKSGDIVLKLKTEWGTYYASVFERVSGIQIEDTDCSDEIMYQYGKALGKMHSLSTRYAPITKKWGHEQVLEWIRQTACKYNAPDFVLSEVDAVKKELSKLPRDTNYYGLIHYDFELDNVFYDESSKICSVIDFDDGMYHWYALDIVQVYDCILNEVDKKKVENAKTCFINGYKTEFFHSDEVEKMLPLMRRFCTLFSYSRKIRCIDKKFLDEPVWMEELRKKLEVGIKKDELSMRTK